MQKKQVGALSEECGGRTGPSRPATVRLVGPGQISNGNVRAVVSSNHIAISRISDGEQLLAGPLPSFAAAECGPVQHY